MSLGCRRCWVTGKNKSPALCAKGLSVRIITDSRRESQDFLESNSPLGRTDWGQLMSPCFTVAASESSVSERQFSSIKEFKISSAHSVDRELVASAVTNRLTLIKSHN